MYPHSAIVPASTTKEGGSMQFGSAESRFLVPFLAVSQGVTFLLMIWLNYWLSKPASAGDTQQACQRRRLALNLSLGYIWVFLLGLFLGSILWMGRPLSRSATWLVFGAIGGAIALQAICYIVQVGIFFLESRRNPTQETPRKSPDNEKRIPH
jgi:hypothetical protein